MNTMDLPHNAIILDGEVHVPAVDYPNNNVNICAICSMKKPCAKLIDKTGIDGGPCDVFGEGIHFSKLEIKEDEA